MDRWGGGQEERMQEWPVCSFALGSRPLVKMRADEAGVHGGGGEGSWTKAVEAASSKTLCV